MVLKGSKRGGAMELARHLLKAENEHVELHEIRGFVARDVPGALKEAQAIALGTRCKQHLFSLSLNPPADASVAVDVFEKAIETIEAKLGLTGQPRVVIFHEKEARRHAHGPVINVKFHMTQEATKIGADRRSPPILRSTARIESRAPRSLGCARVCLTLLLGGFAAREARKFGVGNRSRRQ